MKKSIEASLDRLGAFDDRAFGHRARQLRLDTLVRLRWLAVSGQAAALFVSHVGLGVTIPVAPCLACLAASALLNVALRARFPVSMRLNDVWATRVLAFDIAQLAALLALTGGLANPFSILFLAPIMTSAVSLPWPKTLRLLALALFCATVLEFWYRPLGGPDGGAIQPPPLYRVALWAAIGVSAIFVSIYGSRVATEARQLASALAATELMLARAQHLTQLDGLAAAAAHELGTPLATVALVVRELANQPRVAAQCADDLRLVEDQVARCRAILGKLSSPTDMATAPIHEAALGQLIEEIAAPHRLLDIAIEVVLSGDGPEPVCRRNPATLYGLTNIVENAVAFAASKVTIEAGWTRREVHIVIVDDGPGFSVQVLAQVGEPYISDRASARRGEGEPAGGLGLGLFIAKALLERTGAQMRIGNAATPHRGASVAISWPYATFVQTKRVSEA
jgi:two-component system sensor histidine kinase RegB